MISLKRILIDKLIEWKNDTERKPLILKGARQVGKTWIMKEFGKNYFDNFVYCNFDEEVELASIFSANKQPQRIVELLSMIKMQSIIPGKTLIIFDEIQECSDALNSLKYFMEGAPQYHIISAGSLLGTLLAQPKSYPVGKVDILNVEPLSFYEFLLELNPGLCQYLDSLKPEHQIEEIFHNRLLEMFYYYEIIGGMPECVLLWSKYKDPKRVLKAQKDIIDIYENDFSKHNGKVNSAKILQVFRSIPSQLAKENAKFVYGALKEGSRAKDFEEAIEWLVSAGLLNRIYNVSKIEAPLPAYDNLNAFKLYFFDTGLLKCMAGVDNNMILLDQAYQFKGALAENYILQQLKHKFDVAPRYFSDKRGEIDYLLQNNGSIIPCEVKAGRDKSASTFKKFIQEKHPEIALRFSQMGYLKNGEITNVPLYLADRIRYLIL